MEKQKIRLYSDKELEIARKNNKEYVDAFYKGRKLLMDMHPLRTLFLEVTSRCNAHCDHCGSSCGDFIPKDEITGEEIKGVLKDIYDKGYDTTQVMLAVTGGEPLLRKDLFELMKYARSLGYPWGITSNGILIDKEMVKKMEEAEMYSISVSIDGLKETHEEFRHVKGSWEKIINGLKLMLKSKVISVVQVTTVVNKKNIDQLEDIYNYIYKIGIRHWRVVQVDPIGRAKHSNILLDPDETEYMFNFIAEKQREGKMEVLYGCSHFLGMDVEPIIRQTPFICVTGITIGSILSNGDIFVCPDVERRPELIQGNIRKEKFTKVWETKYKEFRKLNRTTNEKCKKCKDWKLCGGDALHTWDFSTNEPGFCHLEMFLRKKETKKKPVKKKIKKA